MVTTQQKHGANPQETKKGETAYHHRKEPIYKDKGRKKQEEKKQWKYQATRKQLVTWHY